MTFGTKVGHRTPMTGKILRYGYLDNRCHGYEKAVLTAQRFPLMARKCVKMIQIEKGPKPKLPVTMVTNMFPW